VTVDVREGSPTTTIVDAARDHGVDLVVMGTRGHTGLARIALGGTARSVVIHAPCSVLVVRGQRVAAAARPVVSGAATPTS
jgi:universal stress protein A